ncbi:uncharacterized protein LOC135924386 [Gordionus sp. m RMFG-2023]|uniref:uncharacterized protein LOC135924386 n=1 Tax=Gordionus sp. m RMFG-2023 TaxID=3053472 RepID=UPI0031FC5080
MTLNHEPNVYALNNLSFKNKNNVYVNPLQEEQLNKILNYKKPIMKIYSLNPNCSSNFISYRIYRQRGKNEDAVKYVKSFTLHHNILYFIEPVIFYDLFQNYAQTIENIFYPNSIKYQNFLIILKAGSSIKAIRQNRFTNLESKPFYLVFGDLDYFTNNSQNQLLFHTMLHLNIVTTENFFKQEKIEIDLIGKFLSKICNIFVNKTCQQTPDCPTGLSDGPHGGRNMHHNESINYTNQSIILSSPDKYSVKYFDMSHYIRQAISDYGDSSFYVENLNYKITDAKNDSKKLKLHKRSIFSTYFESHLRRKDYIRFGGINVVKYKTPRHITHLHYTFQC